MLSEADKLLLNLNTEKSKDSNFIIYKHKETGFSMLFKKEGPLKGVSLEGFNALTPKNVEAIYFKFKELGWLK